MAILFKKKKKESDKYKLAMNKTRGGIFSSIKSLVSGNRKIDDDFFEELEELFISADIGVKTTFSFIEKLKSDCKKKKLQTTNQMSDLIKEGMKKMYLTSAEINSDLKDAKPLTVYLVVGVNGVGKTTTIAKLSNKLKGEGLKVAVAAGDTFRAGAVDQIKVWGERVGFEVVSKAAGSDPASVVFEGIKYSKDNNYDVLICDTAGRLQNKKNLMDELAKIKRVIEREVPDGPHETLLVIDATTGQNGLTQAKVFKETTDLTGVVLTKLDGTAKGGIVLAIKNDLDIPIKLVGLGEGVDDLEIFDIDKYLEGLFADFV